MHLIKNNDMNTEKKIVKPVQKTTNINPNKKPKKKKDKVTIFAWIVSIIVILGIICGSLGVYMLYNMIKERPELDIYDFQNSESSIVYDRNGNVVAELGTTIRENVSYNDLPNNVIDAFVAVEDSRFFEHNGFDLPRFTKAFLENLKTMSFSQGGSTFTMQLVKNTYFTNDETGENAARSGLSGIQRKAQEIALAIELEKQLPKEKILELYLNKLNFGGGSRNIRGIQKASLYYFGKEITDVTLQEAAFLAGVVNAPSAFNPFFHLEAATKRRNDVLYLMKQHGYIDEDEYMLAINTKLEDSLVSDTNGGYVNERGTGGGTKYQAYIDAVVNEVITTTGLDPYTTTMKIYTFMDPTVQEQMDKIQRGDVDDYFEFPDDNFELASIATNIKTGEIVGILGGRNYADGGALLLNHATDQYKQPGSSIKPILDYILAFEHLGWATDHVLVDKPITYQGTNIVIGNSDGKYRGEVTLNDCIGNSLNTTAIQTLQQVVNEIGPEKVVNYLNSIGFTKFTPDQFDIQWAIGGGEFTVSCKQMASAMGVVINKGQYYVPHTIRRIEFANGKEPIEKTYMPTQAISEQASYLMSKILNKNVYGGYANLMNILKESEYAVYGKTGTTDWGTSGRPYGIPDGAIKDGWCVGATSDYAVATWVGYEKAIKDEPSYMTFNQYMKCIKEKTTNLILDSTVAAFGLPDKQMGRPDGVSTITHIISIFPYVNPIEGMEERFITTGEIITKYASLNPPESIGIESISDDCNISYDVHGVTTLSWPEYPDKSKLEVASEQMDLCLRDSEGNITKENYGTRLFDYSWAFGSVKYKANINIVNTSGATTYSNTITSGSNTYSTHDIPVGPGDKITVNFYYAYENGAASSNTVTKEYTASDSDVSIPLPADLSSVEAIKNWCNNNGIPNNIEVVINASISDETKVEITLNGVSLTNNPFSVKQSQLKNIKVKYYSKPVPSIAVTADLPEYIITSENPKPKLTVTITNVTDPELTFSTSENLKYDGSVQTNKHVDVNNGQATIQFDEISTPGTYSVEFKESKSNLTKTFTFEVKGTVNPSDGTE